MYITDALTCIYLYFELKILTYFSLLIIPPDSPGSTRNIYKA